MNRRCFLKFTAVAATGLAGLGKMVDCLSRFGTGAAKRCTGYLKSSGKLHASDIDGPAPWAG